MTNPKISRRYILIPIVLVVFFLLFYLVYADIKDNTINEFNKEQLILAQTASRGVTSFFDDYKSDLSYLAQFDDIIGFSEKGKQFINGFYENHKNYIEAVTRVDARGVILFTSPFNQSVIGEDISYQKHVREVIATHQPVISDVFKSVQGFPAIALHVPVFQGKEFKGSLAILILIDKLGKRYLNGITIRGTGNAWLLSENGIEIFCPFQGHTGKSLAAIAGNEKATLEFLERIRKETNGTSRGIHNQIAVNGASKFIEKYLVFYRVPLRNTYWTILISYQEKDIYQALSQLRNRLIFVFFLLFVVVLYYFYSLSKVRTVLNEEIKRKRAEKTLRESEEKFRTIFDESPIGIELYQANGLQVNANKSSLDMFGIPDVPEAKNFNLFDGISLDAENIEKLKSGEPINFQASFDFEKVKVFHQYRSNRTDKAFFDYTITPLFDAGPKTINGYLLQVQDITERKRAEADILMLAHSLRSINECVSITDMENKILFVNKAFLVTYGYEEEELTGKHMGFIRSEENDLVLLNDVLPATLRGGWKGELKNRKKDGSEFYIQLSTSVIHDKEGQPLGLIGVAADITNQKQSELELIIAKERAEESDRLKTAFLANMSHEIRTPMNGILGFSELLKEPDLTGEEQHRYITIIERSGKRMLNIINDLIDISRIEAGQTELFFSATNINEQIDFLFTFFKPEAAKKGIKLSCHRSLPSSEANIITDREKVYAVLTNLIKNALKYSDSGLIHFGYEIKPNPNGDSVQFYVMDNGIGIPKDRQEAVFERFVQADIEDRNALQGAGLGLAISKAYVEMMGGKIWLESEEGRGSTFFFTIPYNRGLSGNDFKTRKTPGGQSEISGSAGNKLLKILIADDEEYSDFIVTQALRKFSREILHAKTGHEAIEICKHNPDIDLILMDIKMPLMDGYQATRQIRKFNNTVIIIAQTAFALLGDKEKAIEAGCNDHISKPINKEKLQAMVGEIKNKPGRIN